MRAERSATIPCFRFPARFQAGGEVYSFGYGWNGRLGLGNEENQLSPQLVAALRGRSVVQVSAGRTHSLALLKVGAEMSFAYLFF